LKNYVYICSELLKDKIMSNKSTRFIDIKNNPN